MAKAVTVDKLLYTPVEAAHALGVSRSTIYVLMTNGERPSVRIGASRRVPAEELRRYIAVLSAKLASCNQGDTRERQLGRQHLWK